MATAWYKSFSGSADADWGRGNNQAKSLARQPRSRWVNEQSRDEKPRLHNKTQEHDETKPIKNNYFIGYKGMFLS